MCYEFNLFDLMPLRKHAGYIAIASLEFFQVDERLYLPISLPVACGAGLAWVTYTLHMLIVAVLP